MMPAMLLPGASRLRLRAVSSTALARTTRHPLAMLPVGFALLALACQSGADAGASCTASSECSSPLVCRLSRCRSECAASRDCPAGARCLLDATGLGACSLASDDRCEASGTTCPSGLTCLGMRCVNTCTDARDCPRDGECREVVGAGISFCFAPTREDGGTDDGGSIDAGIEDTGTTQDVGQSTDAGPCTSADCAIDVCLGDAFTCAVRGDHAVVCWGANHLGQLGDGTDATTASSHAPFSCPDPSDTTTIDCSPRAVQVLRMGGDPLTADAVACSAGTACARELTTGAVECWGAGGNGELGGSSAAPSFRARSVAGVPNDPLMLSAGRAFFCTTYASPGHVVCWGEQSAGQFGLPMSATGNPLSAPHWDGQALTTGGVNTCGLAADVVRCAGDDTYGQVGPASLVDGGVQYGPVTVPLPAGTLTSLVAGDSFECVLVDGAPYCWGFAQTGSLGRTVSLTCAGSYTCDPTPGPVDGSARFDTLWVEGETSRICGRSGADTLCWGQYSQIGCEPGGASCTTPHVVPELAGATQVASSARAICAILGSGQLVCSGNDAFGQLGRGSASTTTTGLATDYQPVCLGVGC